MSPGNLSSDGDLSDVDLFASGSAAPLGPQPSLLHSSYAGSSSPAPSGPEEEANLARKRQLLYSCYIVKDTSPVVSKNIRKAIPQTKDENACEMFRFYYSDEAYKSGEGKNLFIKDYITLAEISFDEKNSTNDDSPSVKFGKAFVAEQNIGDDCKVGGWLHWFDTPNNTRVHIDEEGAKDIENYRILVETLFTDLLNRESSAMTKESFLNRVKEFTSIAHISEFERDAVRNGNKSFANMLDADVGKTAKELAKTFLVNIFLRGIRSTEEVNEGQLKVKDFAFVQIERPQDGNGKINVKVGRKPSYKLSRVNVAVGNGKFAQLHINRDENEEAIVMDRAQGVKYFKHNKIKDNFTEEKFEKVWFWGDNRRKILGSASTPIIKTTYLRKDQENLGSGETESQESESFKVKDGNIVGNGRFWGGSTRVAKKAIWGITGAPIPIANGVIKDLGDDFTAKLSGSRLILNGLSCKNLVGKRFYTKMSNDGIPEAILTSTRNKVETVLEDQENGNVRVVELNKKSSSGWGVREFSRVKLQNPKLISIQPATKCHSTGHERMSDRSSFEKSTTTTSAYI
jgi:hypothetical protein